MELAEVPVANDTPDLEAPAESTFSADKLGMLASVLCLIHCFGLPFLLAALPVLNVELGHSEWIHFGMLVLIVPLALYAFVDGYRRHHALSVLLLGGAGLLFVLLPLGYDLVAGLAHAGHDHAHEGHDHGEVGHAIWESVSAFAGGILLVAGHWRNLSLGDCCDHDHH